MASFVMVIRSLLTALSDCVNDIVIIALPSQRVMTVCVCCVWPCAGKG